MCNGLKIVAVLTYQIIDGRRTNRVEQVNGEFHQEHHE